MFLFSSIYQKWDIRETIKKSERFKLSFLKYTIEYYWSNKETKKVLIQPIAIHETMSKKSRI